MIDRFTFRTINRPYYRNNRNFRSQREPDVERNERIRAREVRLIDQEGNNVGVIDTRKALEMAREAEMDLVLISKGADVPVAKIIDWAKFKYLKNKKTKSKQITSKEWWFKPNIEEHDIQNKLNNIKKFLKKGGKAKVTVRFAKRATFEGMRDTLNKILELSSEFSEPESEINKEGRNLSIFLKNKKKKDEK